MNPSVLNMRLAPEAIPELQELCKELGISVDIPMLELGDEIIKLSALSMGDATVVPCSKEEWDRANSS